MKVILDKKPKNPTIIDGFPGFGLVGTIASEFLLEHLQMEKIGRIWVDELPAMIAIHQSKVVEPIGIFYNKKYNLVIIHAVSAVIGMEWKITEKIMDMAKEMKAKEIISLEGIGSAVPNENPKVYYYSTKEKQRKKIAGTGAEPLKEGIIMGTAGILLLKSQLPVTTIFAETHSELPDSKAAAKVIETLDKYLGLKVDYKPLLKQAEKFEEKLKELLVKGKKMTTESEKKRLSYVG